MVLRHLGLEGPGFLELATGVTVGDVRPCQVNSPLDHMLSEIKKGMEEMARMQEEVGLSFSYAVITQGDSGDLNGYGQTQKIPFILFANSPPKGKALDLCGVEIGQLHTHP